MKKIIGAVIAVVMVLGLAGCATQSDRSKNLAGVKQNMDNGLPKWVGHDFDYEDASYFLDGYIPSKKGIFSDGKGKLGDERASEIQATLDARANLAARVKAEIDRRRIATKTEAGEMAVERISEVLVGPQRIDTFKGKDGTVYILMYISEENVKETAKQADPKFADQVDKLFMGEPAE